LTLPEATSPLFLEVTKMTFNIINMKRLSILFAAFAAVCAVACSRNIDDVQSDHEFTISASYGEVTKVNAGFGDTQNTINFTWAEDDSIFVCFVPKDSVATMTEEKANALQSYVFKIKSGAGTTQAVFSCKNLSPSPMKSGVTYVMYAVYNPCIDNVDCGMPYWWILSERDNSICNEFHVNPDQTHNPDMPLSNVAKAVVLMSPGVEVTVDSSPSVSFIHQISLFRVKVKNVGSETLNIKSFSYPSSKVGMRTTTRGGYRYYGEDRGTIICAKEVCINAGEIYPFYIAMIP